ncbi:MAG: hypothetical protein MZW92_34760 [Comamonadaceae bacterium]|nr:hypothetical protein [Comamonadaceae bacterium]
MRVPLPAAMIDDVRVPCGSVLLLKARGLSCAGAAAGCWPAAARCAWATTTAPQLAWWWLDGYFDFDREQRPRVRAGASTAGSTGTARTAAAATTPALLARAPARACCSRSTPAQVCALAASELRGRSTPALRAGAARRRPRCVPRPARAAVAPPRAALRQAAATRCATTTCSPTCAKRQAAIVKRTRRARRDALRPARRGAAPAASPPALAASPFDPERWLAERERRQRETAADAAPAGRPSAADADAARWPRCARWPSAPQRSPRCRLPRLPASG